MNQWIQQKLAEYGPRLHGPCPIPMCAVSDTNSTRLKRHLKEHLAEIYTRRQNQQTIQPTIQLEANQIQEQTSEVKIAQLLSEAEQGSAFHQLIEIVRDLNSNKKALQMKLQKVVHSHSLGAPSDRQNFIVAQKISKEILKNGAMFIQQALMAHLVPAVLHILQKQRIVTQVTKDRLKRQLVSQLHTAKIRLSANTWHQELNCWRADQMKMQKQGNSHPNTKSQHKTAFQFLDKFKDSQLKIQFQLLNELSKLQPYKRARIGKYYNRVIEQRGLNFPMISKGFLDAKGKNKRSWRIVTIQEVKAFVNQLINRGQPELACDIFCMVCIGLRKSDFLKVYFRHREIVASVLIVQEQKTGNITTRIVPQSLKLLIKHFKVSYPITKQRFRKMCQTCLSKFQRFYGLRHLCITTCVTALLHSSQIQFHKIPTTTLRYYINTQNRTLINKMFQLKFSQLQPSSQQATYYRFKFMKGASQADISVQQPSSPLIPITLPTIEQYSSIVVSSQMADKITYTTQGQSSQSDSSERAIESQRQVSKIQQQQNPESQERDKAQHQEAMVNNPKQKPQKNELSIVGQQVMDRTITKQKHQKTQQATLEQQIIQQSISDQVPTVQKQQQPSIKHKLLDNKAAATKKQKSDCYGTLQYLDQYFQKLHLEFCRVKKDNFQTKQASGLVGALSMAFGRGSIWFIWQLQKYPEDYMWEFNRQHLFTICHQLSKKHAKALSVYVYNSALKGQDQMMVRLFRHSQIHQLQSILWIQTPSWKQVRFFYLKAKEDRARPKVIKRDQKTLTIKAPRCGKQGCRKLLKMITCKDCCGYQACPDHNLHQCSKRTEEQLGGNLFTHNKVFIQNYNEDSLEQLVRIPRRSEENNIRQRIIARGMVPIDRPQYQQTLPSKIKILQGLQMLSQANMTTLIENRQDQNLLPFLVLDSDIKGAGEGVFVSATIEPNSLICSYLGEIVYHHHRGKCDSAFELGWMNRNMVIIRPLKASNVGRWINSSNEKSKINAKSHMAFAGPPLNQIVVFIYSTRKIKPGQEILYLYGNRYWEPNT